MELIIFCQTNVERSDSQTASQYLKKRNMWPNQWLFFSHLFESCSTPPSRVLSFYHIIKSQMRVIRKKVNLRCQPWKRWLNHRRKSKYQFFGYSKRDPNKLTEFINYNTPSLKNTSSEATAGNRRNVLAECNETEKKNAI